MEGRGREVARRNASQPQVDQMYTVFDCGHLFPLIVEDREKEGGEKGREEIKEGGGREKGGW